MCEFDVKIYVVLSIFGFNIIAVDDEVGKAITGAGYTEFEPYKTSFVFVSTNTPPVLACIIDAINVSGVELINETFLVFRIILLSVWDNTASFPIEIQYCPWLEFLELYPITIERVRWFIFLTSSQIAIELVLSLSHQQTYLLLYRFFDYHFHNNY